MSEGRQSEIFQRYPEGSFDPNCCFSIYHGSHRESLDLVSPSGDEARTWVTGLRYLMAGISDEDSLARRQRTRDQYPWVQLATWAGSHVWGGALGWEAPPPRSCSGSGGGEGAGPAGPTLAPNLAPKWLKQTFDEADKNGDGSLSITEVLQLLHKLNVNLPRQRVKQMFKVRLAGLGAGGGVRAVEMGPRTRASRSTGVCLGGAGGDRRCHPSCSKWRGGSWPAFLDPWGAGSQTPQVATSWQLCGHHSSSPQGLPRLVDGPSGQALGQEGEPPTGGCTPHPPAPRLPSLPVSSSSGYPPPSRQSPATLVLAVRKMHPQLSSCLDCLMSFSLSGTPAGLGEAGGVSRSGVRVSQCPRPDSGLAVLLLPGKCILCVRTRSRALRQTHTHTRTQPATPLPGPWQPPPALS